MVNKTTIAWRVGILLLLAVAIPVGFYWHDAKRQVGIEAMLDVSVSVKTISHVEIDALGDSVWTPTSGSGFLISSNGCEVLTNHHVVADAARVEIYPRHWSETAGIPATIVNSNPRSDIAILRMSDCAGIPEAKLGDSDLLRPGDEVYAVGNPLGNNPDSITRGIVSHTERFTSGLIPYLQTDATISRGSSGGALFNREGEVIGINTAIIATKSGNTLGVGYALPVNLVRNETKKLHAGPPTWGDAGIEQNLTGLNEREASFFQVPEGRAAIIVTDSPEEGPSKGKLFAKDVIYEIGNMDITNVKQAQRFIGSHNPGDKLTFKVIRAGEHVDVEVTLREGWKTKEIPGADYYLGHLGLSLEMWDTENELRGQFDAPVITQVQSLGPAHLAYVTSSQKTIARNGPLVLPIQLEVKTLSGVAYDGKHYTVDSIEKLEELATKAFAANLPILLEVETWGRANPMKLDEPIERRTTSFHVVQPALTTAEAPKIEQDEEISVGSAQAEPTTSEVAYLDGERGR